MNRYSLTTPVRFLWNGPRFGRASVLASIGSCFSEELVGRLLDAEFRAVSNPNGILYNPLSIADALERIAEKEVYREDEFFEFNGKWRSWLHHGSFADVSRERAVEKCNGAAAVFGEGAGKCDLFIVTLSSAVVYRYLETGRVVANCHKVPGNRFAREILSLEETVAQVERIVALIRKINPSCVILFTLSPIRHYPGDLVLNARSKAQLLSAVHVCCDASEKVCYFPAYEIAQDELRDYRFYREDMLHPTPLAVDIILERFLTQCFDGESMTFFEEARRRKSASLHHSNSNDTEE